MTLLAQIIADGSVAVESIPQVAIADGALNVVVPTLAIADATVDLDAVAAIFPRGEAAFQIVAPFQIRIDGTLVPANRMLPGTTVRESVDGTQSFTFAVAAEGSDPTEFSEPLGTVEMFCGPPANGKKVDIDVVYLTATGPQTVRLLTNGIVTASQRDLESGTRSFAGNGPRSRYDRQKIDLDIPAGAGLTSTRQVTEVLAKLSLTTPSDRSRRFPRKRYKEIAAREAPAMDLAQRILQPESKILFFDRDGLPAIRSLQIPEQPDGPTFTAADILLEQGGVNEDTSAEGPTEVCVRGVEQVLGGLDGSSFTSRNGKAVEGPTGQKLFVVFYTSFESRKRGTVEVVTASFPVPFADKKISTVTGTQVASGVTQTTKVDVVTSTREVLESLDFCTVTIEDQSTGGWYQRARSVGTTNITTQVVDFIVGRLIDSITNRGVNAPHATFQQVQRVLVSKGYDADGFLIGEQRSTFSHYLIRRATRDFQITPDNQYEYRSGISILLNGDGVVTGSPEPFILTERETKTHNVTEDGFVEKTTTLIEKYFVTPLPPVAAQYSYGSGIFSDDEREQFKLFQTITEIFEPLSGDSSHRVTKISQTNDGRPRIIDTSDDLPGFLPAAEKKQESIPDPTEFPNGKVACPGNQRAVEACYSSAVLEGKREAWTDFVGADRVEDADEALDLAKALFEIANAGRQTFSVPINATIRPGLEVTFSPGPFSIDRVLLVEEVQHAETDGGSITTITGRFDLV